MAMKTGFGRINLRTSSLVAGGISFMMIFMTIAVQSLIFWLNYFEYDEKRGHIPYYRAQRTAMARGYYISCAVVVILWFTVLRLLYGAYKGQRAFLTPYLIAFGILVPVNISYIIWILLHEDIWVAALFPVTCVPFTCYCLCVVGSHYIQLNPKNQHKFQIPASTIS